MKLNVKRNEINNIFADRIRNFHLKVNHVLAVLALHIVNVFFLFIIGGGSYEVESPNGDGQSRRSVSERSQEGLGA